VAEFLLARDLARWLVRRSGAYSTQRPKAAGMRPVACGPHRPPPAPMPRRRSSPGSDARHRSPDVILGFAEYALSFPISMPVSLSLCSLDNHFCTIVNSIPLFVLDWSQQLLIGQVQRHVSVIILVYITPNWGVIDRPLLRPIYKIEHVGDSCRG